MSNVEKELLECQEIEYMELPENLKKVLFFKQDGVIYYNTKCAHEPDEPLNIMRIGEEGDNEVLNSSNDNFLETWQGIMQMALKLGVDPLVLGARIIANLETGRATYPDDKEKALEFTGNALYEEFGGHKK